MPPERPDDRPEDDAPEHPFAPYVRILGRGPGRSRALTREEARTALTMVLRGEADPHQVGAFLMLLRYRGEDPAEMAGLVEAMREDARCGPLALPVALDWPSYGAGRTRGMPWYLLAALALAKRGHKVLMHGTNAFTSGTPVEAALPMLGLRPAESRADAERLLAETNFAYLPLHRLSPALDRLLGLRALLGLRSPLNTAARLLNPADAPAGVDGVFLPPYLALHLGAAELLGRQRLVVVKGGGGEAERTPGKAQVAHAWDAATGRATLDLPAISERAEKAGDAEFLATWRGEANGPGAATVRATIALGLLALGAAKTVAEADALAGA